MEEVNYTVHYRDRRTNERAAYVERRLPWYGPFTYAHGNWRSDCNRSLEMYPDEPAKHIDLTSQKSILVVEKIELPDGQIVYSDPDVVHGMDSDPTEMEESRLFGAYAAVLALRDCLYTPDDRTAVPALQIRYAIKLLADYPGHANLSPLMLAAIDAGRRLSYPDPTFEADEALLEETERMVRAAFDSVRHRIAEADKAHLEETERAVKAAYDSVRRCRAASQT